MKTALSQLVQGYIEAVYFTETGDEGQPEGDAELSPNTKLCIEQDCARFLFAYSEIIERCDASWEQVGHDLHLTREGHGAGFWDRQDALYPEKAREELTRAAQVMGQFGEFVFAKELAQYTVVNLAAELLEYPEQWSEHRYPTLESALSAMVFAKNSKLFDNAVSDDFFKSSNT